MGEDPYWGYDVGEHVNYEASITARHLDTGKDTTLTVDGNGIMAADLPGGVYGLDLDGGGPESLEEDSNGWSQLSRLSVSRDQVDWYQSYWHGGDSTYVVSGYDYSDQEVYMMHDTGFTSTMETVEDFMYEDIGETFMSALSRAMYVHRSAQDSNFGDREEVPSMMFPPRVIRDSRDHEHTDYDGSVVTHKVVLNTGNKDYDEHWQATMRDDDGNRYYPDDGENPPGSMISEEGWENYEVFKEDLENVFDYSTGGSTNESVGRSFNVEYVEDSAENLHNYLRSWGGDGNLLRPENDVLFIGLHDGPGGVENRNFRRGWSRYPTNMSWSYQYVNDMDASRFTSENNYFFSTRGDRGNVNPGICSVSDFNTSFFVNPDPPGYCTERLKTKPDEDGVRRSINPIDWWIHTTVAGFAPFAQSQFNYNFTEEIVNSSDVEVVRGHLQGDSFGTVFSTYTGFNIKLPEPDREREFEW